MRKATFAELKSGSEWFIAICVSRSKSLPELYIGGSRHETGEIRGTIPAKRDNTIYLTSTSSCAKLSNYFQCNVCIQIFLNITDPYRFLLFGLIKWIQEACKNTSDKYCITTAMLCTELNYTTILAQFDIKAICTTAIKLLKKLYKSCRTLAAYQALLDFIHEQILLQPITVSHCGMYLPSHCDVINWLLRRQS